MVMIGYTGEILKTQSYNFGLYNGRKFIFLQDTSFKYGLVLRVCYFSMPDFAFFFTGGMGTLATREGRFEDTVEYKDQETSKEFCGTTEY